MKTIEVLEKYKIIISSILECEPHEIKFYVEDNEIGEMDYDKDEVSQHWSLGNYSVKYVNSANKPDIISYWKLYQLQHCCAFMVSCGVFVTPDYRNLKIGTILNQLRQDIGRLLGYSAILCTDIDQNINQRKLLKTNGWRDIFNIINKRTNNRVYLSVINI